MKRIFPLLILSSCMVGPKYHKPEMALPDKFIESDEQEDLADSDENLINWWKQLNDPFLNELIEECCSFNFDLRIALEQVWQARAQYQSETAKIFPDIKLDAAAVRTRQSLNIFNSASSAAASTGASDIDTPGVSPIQNYFQLGFDAIWELDFFGKLRRARKAALYTWEATEENARDVRIIVVSEMANNYVAIRALQNLLSLNLEQTWIDEQQLILAQSRFEAGLASETEVLNAKAALDADEAAVADLESTLKQSIYRLAVLLGQEPEAVVARFDEEQPIPLALGKIPAGLPSDLLRRRPDIRGAERQIAAATEQIGIAVADLFPRVYLTATNLFAANPSGSNYGYGSSRLSNLFKRNSLTWSVGPGFSLPLLDFGRRKAVVRAQKSIQKQVLLSYEKTVLTALQEVESALIAYFKQQERLELLIDQTEENRQAFELAKDRFEAGLSDFTPVLFAQQTLIQSEISLAENKQALTTQFISIYKALGGDWQCSNTP